MILSDRHRAEWMTWYKVAFLRAMVPRCMITSLQVLSSASNVRTVLCLILLPWTQIFLYFTVTINVIKWISVPISTIREMGHQKQKVWRLHSLCKAGNEVCINTFCECVFDSNIWYKKKINLHRASSHQFVCWAIDWLIVRVYHLPQGPEYSSKPLRPVDSSFVKWFITRTQGFQRPMCTQFFRSSTHKMHSYCYAVQLRSILCR
jgi:hypothetical protein